MEQSKEPTLQRHIQSWLDDQIGIGRMAGGLVVVLRSGAEHAFAAAGVCDAEGQLPITRDTIFRIYSMTKPITAVAALMLVDDGLLSLDSPVRDFIPSMAKLRVQGWPDDEVTVTIRHLLTHTSGFIYSDSEDAVGKRYLAESTNFGRSDGSLAEICERLSLIPLAFEPGTSWRYGVSLDVLGRVIEIVTGTTLDQFLKLRVFDPLGMVDTSFTVPASKAQRLAALYEVAESSSDDAATLHLVSARGSDVAEGAVTTFSGGAGLSSTIDDYLRFAEMLRLGGLADGQQILSPAMAQEMATNQLPGDLVSAGQTTFNETTKEGIGYGFGVSVVIDAERTLWLTNNGEIAWGGAASTAFWVDPSTDTTVVLLTQVLPSSQYPFRAELRAIVNS